MAFGDIGAPVDTLEFDLTDISRPDMIKVSGSIYAIAYTDADGDGKVVSVNIAADGQIGAAIIDGLEFDEADGAHPSIVHVSGEIFAIAYRGVDADGWVCTVDIAADGAIGAAVIDSFEFEAGACYEPDMIKVADGVFAVVYRDALSNGTTTTVSIAADGQIGAAILDTETFVTGRGSDPQIICVGGSVFAIVHRDSSYDGWVCTVDIDTAGTISTDAIDTLEFDGAQGTDPSICHVLGNIFAIAYRGVDDDGFVTTVSIAANGAIGAAVIDSLEFDVLHCTWPDIIHLARGICAIAYGGENDDGFVVTVQIEADGQIGAAIIDSEEYDISNGTQPSIVRVTGDTYAVAYIGTLFDGFIKTPTIETPITPKHLTMMGIGG